MQFVLYRSSPKNAHKKILKGSQENAGAAICMPNGSLHYLIVCSRTNNSGASTLHLKYLELKKILIEKY